MCVESTTLASKTLCQVLEARLIENKSRSPNRVEGSIAVGVSLDGSDLAGQVGDAHGTAADNVIQSLCHHAIVAN